MEQMSFSAPLVTLHFCDIYKEHRTYGTCPNMLHIARVHLIYLQDGLLYKVNKGCLKLECRTNVRSFCTVQRVLQEHGSIHEKVVAVGRGRGSSCPRGRWWWRNLCADFITAGSQGTRTTGGGVQSRQRYTTTKYMSFMIPQMTLNSGNHTVFECSTCPIIPIMVLLIK